VIYKELDHAGNISVGMAKVKEYKAQCGTLKKSNRTRATAYAKAKKAWIANPEHKGVPYPVERPLQGKRVVLKISNNEQSSTGYLTRLEAKLREKRDSFVVYKEVDHAGDISVGMAKVNEYRALCGTLKKSNMTSAKAYAAAAKAWYAEPEHEGVPFPLMLPVQAKCVELKRIKDEQGAREYLDKLAVELAKLKEEREIERNSLAPTELSEAERKKAERDAALLEEATTLFINKLVALTAEAEAGT